MSELSFKGLSPAEIKSLRRHCVGLSYQAERSSLIRLTREVFDSFCAQQAVEERLKAPLEKFVSQTLDDVSRIDGWIRQKSTNWTPERMGRIDLAILRVCLTELVHRSDAKPAIVIADAAEIAKEFGSDHSQSFVHGILDAVVQAFIEPRSKQEGHT